MSGLFVFSLSADDRYARLYKEKCAVERMCEDKQEVNRTNQIFTLETSFRFDIKYLVQLIVSLERRLTELRETLEKVRDGFLDKSAEVELLQEKANDRVRP